MMAKTKRKKVKEMVKLTQERVKDILSYMEDDLPNCLYLYGDIVRYGVDDSNMTVWFSEENGKIKAVVMKYFSGSHVYSKNLDYDLDEVVEKLREINPDRVSSQREIIKSLFPFFQDGYDVEYGEIFKHYHYRKMKSPVPIERAKPEDAGKIAEFLMTHETWSKTYDKDRLADELADRMRLGIGRSYIIRDGDQIVAHDSFALETDRYVVGSLALVHEDYRKRMYGVFLESYIVNEIYDEGKDNYSMITDIQRIKGLTRRGNLPVAYYGKLFRRK